MKKFAVLFFIPSVLLAQQNPNTIVYDQVKDSVVAVRSDMILGERSGTGVVLTQDGYILTSYAVVQEGSENIRVWLKGPKLYQAKLIATSKKDEIALLKIEPKEILKPISFGESGKVKIGDVSFTIGNAYNSFINDDQPSFCWGIISGIYKLKELKANSEYAGYVLETTAAVNWGMEGAPLLDCEGKMIGIITLNYSPNRWLGNAIPIDILKDRVHKLMKSPEDSTTDTVQDDAQPKEGYLGLKVKQDDKNVLVQEVDKEGPAYKMGLRAGDKIVKIGVNRISSVDEFMTLVSGLKAGDVLWLTIDSDGLVDEIKITLTEKK